MGKHSKKCSKKSFPIIASNTNNNTGYISTINYSPVLYDTISSSIFNNGPIVSITTNTSVMITLTSAIFLLLVQQR